MLKIYGANLSGPANKVRMTANVIGLDYEYVQINLREGEHRKEEYLKISPTGKVPAIDDDGFTLFESGAICRYLCEKHNSSLFPNAQNEKAVVDAWSDFVAQHVAAAMNRLVFNRLFASMINVEVDERSVEDGLTFLGKFLPIVDTQLGKTECLASSTLTLADLTLLTALDPAEVVKYDIAPYSNVVKWRNTQMQQDYYTKCHTNYEEALNKVMAAFQNG